MVSWFPSKNVSSDRRFHPHGHLLTSLPDLSDSESALNLYLIRLFT